MDYMKFVEHHRATGADITIGCLPVDMERASDFGLMKIDEDGRIVVRALVSMSKEAAVRASLYCIRQLNVVHVLWQGVAPRLCS